MLDLTVGGPTANTPTILWLKALQRLYEWDATKLQAITGKLEQLPLGFPEELSGKVQKVSTHASSSCVRAPLACGSSRECDVLVKFGVLFPYTAVTKI